MDLGTKKRYVHTHVKGSDPVVTMKRNVAKAEGIPQSPLFLYFNGRPLEDERIMDEYPDIRDGSIVSMSRHERAPPAAIAFSGSFKKKEVGAQAAAQQVPQQQDERRPMRPMGAYEMRMLELERKMNPNKAPGQMNDSNMPIAGAPTGLGSAAKGRMGANNPLLLGRGRARPMLLPTSTTMSGTQLM